MASRDLHGLIAPSPCSYRWEAQATKILRPFEDGSLPTPYRECRAAGMGNLHTRPFVTDGRRIARIWSIAICASPGIAARRSVAPFCRPERGARFKSTSKKRVCLCQRRSTARADAAAALLRVVQFVLVVMDGGNPAT